MRKKSEIKLLTRTAGKQSRDLNLTLPKNMQERTFSALFCFVQPKLAANAIFPCDCHKERWYVTRSNTRQFPFRLAK